MKKKQSYIVTKDGVDCGYHCPGCFGFKRGVLAKTTGRPAVFGGQKSANQAIARTVKTIGVLRNSMLDDWDKITPILEPGKWAVRPAITS